MNWSQGVLLQSRESFGAWWVDAWCVWVSPFSAFVDERWKIGCKLFDWLVCLILLLSCVNLTALGHIKLTARLVTFNLYNFMHFVLNCTSTDTSRLFMRLYLKRLFLCMYDSFFCCYTCVHCVHENAFLQHDRCFIMENIWCLSFTDCLSNHAV